MKKTEGEDFREKRKDFRRPCFFIEVDYSACQGIYTEAVRNISTSGVFIETDCPIPVGDRIDMLFSDFAKIDLVKVSGDVVRANGDGFAVEFDLLKSDQNGKLTSYINNV